MVTTWYKYSVPGILKFTLLVEHLLIIITICSISRSREDDFSRNIVHTFYSFNSGEVYVFFSYQW